jgi:RNA polymerase sigma-70 factor (ECF subfamily)
VNGISAPSSAAGAPVAAVERIYRDRYADFLRVCIALTGNREAAHDAVQEGFTRGLRGLPAGIAPAAVEPWLWRAVTNAARDQRRRSATRLAGTARLRQMTAAPGEPAAEEPGPAAAALGRLSERQRLVVFLRYYADLSHDQIAAALGIRPGTVAATLHAAHRSLRSALVQEAT